MVAKSYWDRLVAEFVRVVQGHSQTDTIEVQGRIFQVQPGVFSPIYSSDTRWFAEELVPLLDGRSFLEIGCGAGIISCLAAMNGASKVVATDLNEHAVENTQKNADRHKLEISVRHGHLFEPISDSEKFDVIFWNHPFNYTEDKSKVDDPIGSSVFDLSYQSLKEFISKGSRYLTDQGELLLGTSSVARIRLIQEISKSNGYKLELVAKTEVPVHQKRKTQMDLRIYSLVGIQNK